MATNDVLLRDGTQLLFADHAADFGAAPATAANSLIIGTPTDVQIDGTNLAAAAARQSAKTADLGAARAYLYFVSACLEFASAPTSGGTVDFYWAESPSATAGTGNPAGVSGADAAYTGTSGDSLADSLLVLTYIGSLILTADVINIGPVGSFTPGYRYGSLVLVNNGSTGFHATVMDETHIVMTPQIEEIQAAV